MARMMRCACLLVILGLLAAPRAEAQGIGPLIDWITKLSGPQFRQAGGSVSFRLEEEKKHRLRIAVSGGTSFDEDVASDPSITIVTTQATVEAAIKDSPVEVVLGVALHSFSGDVDTFSQVSFPVKLQVRPKLFGKVFGRLAAGANIFPSFSDDAFAPQPVNVSTDGGEIVWSFSAGLDIDLDILNFWLVR